MDSNPKIQAIVQILFGVTNDAPGIVIGADGKPHRVPGWDPVSWNELTTETRDVLVSMAVNELANLITETKLRTEIQSVALNSLKTQAQRLTATTTRKAA
jgi:hypothetical protein